MTVKKALRYNPDDVRRLGHEGLSKPYFQEFRGLLAHRRGVPAFPSRLSYGEFFNVSRGGRMDLQAYFQLLADFARTKEKVPVFCLNRSWGRIGAFRNLLPESVHVFSLRNPEDTWESQKARRSYFFAKLLYIYSKSEPAQTKKDFPEIADLSLLERLRSERTFKRKIAEISDERIEPVFWCAYVTALLNGVQHADFILDLDQVHPGSDDRLALGHYLELLPGRERDKNVLRNFQRLSQTKPVRHGKHTCPARVTKPYWQGFEVPRPTSAVFLEVSCKVAPKLSDANRNILSRLIVPAQDTAC